MRYGAVCAVATLSFNEALSCSWFLRGTSMRACVHGYTMEECPLKLQAMRVAGLRVYVCICKMRWYTQNILGKYVQLASIFSRPRQRFMGPKGAHKLNVNGVFTTFSA